MTNPIIRHIESLGYVVKSEPDGLSATDTRTGEFFRVRAADGYAANWQLLEERMDEATPFGSGDVKRRQYIWGARYIDDIVRQRTDMNADDDFGDAGVDKRYYHLTDVQFSTAALLDAGSSSLPAVTERNTYTAYGQAQVHKNSDLDGDGDVDGVDQGILNGAWGNPSIHMADLNRDGIVNGTDLALLTGEWTGAGGGQPLGRLSHAGVDNIIGYDGYVFNPEAETYTVRFRTYFPHLGRWGERDPLGAVDGMNLYQFVLASPLMHFDYLGLMAVGHHYVANDICKNRMPELSDAAKDFFRRFTSGPLPWHHRSDTFNGVSHKTYTDKVLDELRRFLDETATKACDMTEEQAKEFGERIKSGRVCKENIEIKKWLEGFEERRAKELAKIKAAGERAAKRRANKGRAGGARGAATGGVLLILGAAFLLDATGDALADSDNCQRFLRSAGKSECGSSVYNYGHACVTDIHGFTGEEVIGLSFQYFVEQYAAACELARAEAARCCKEEDASAAEE